MSEQNVKDTPKSAVTSAEPAGAPAELEAGAAAELAISALARRPGRPRFGGMQFPGAPLAQIGQPGPVDRPDAAAAVVASGEVLAEAAEDPADPETKPGDDADDAMHRGGAAGEPGPPSPAQILEDWFSTPQGAYILEWELARIDQAVADIFGYYAVQIGLPGIDFLRANRITTHLTASLAGKPSVHADAHELPFESESLDLVVLPHLLEFSSEPHQILREVERVLRPEGQVIIFCFNPVSLWGLKKMFTHTPPVPWGGEFVSVLRMKDWLKLLNFEMRGGRYGRYRPPYISQKWLSRFGFLEKAGDRWWPVAGAVYLMQATKRVPGMRIVTPSWRRARKAEALAASPNVNRRPTTHAPQYVHHNPHKKTPKE